MVEGRLKDKMLVAGVSIIISLVGLLIVVITVRKSFSAAVFQTTTVVLVLLLALVTVYTILGPPLSGLFKKLRRSRRYHVLTKKHFSEFERLVDTLDELFDPQRYNSMVRVLQQITQIHRELQGKVPSAEHFRDLLRTFRVASGTLRRSTTNFLVLLAWFDSIVSLYNRHLVCEPVEKSRLVQRQDPDQQKMVMHKVFAEEYNTNKATYVAFLHRQMDFAKAVNKDFGKKIAREYFDLPRDL